MHKKWYSLIDKIYCKKNLKASFKRVRANKGSAGIDGITVAEFEEKESENLEELHMELKTNRYEPLPVKRVYIDKGNGKKRPLGIPSVRDRVVQQALKNVLEPIFEPDFHPSSYGYRPNKSCHKAVAKAEMFINKYGLEYVVDMDLSKCFDTLDHDMILDGVWNKVSDGRVLDLIRKILKSGVMEGLKYDPTEIGSPQGGVISPLLMNIYLDKFDQELKSQRIRIVRYADDILIFANSKSKAVRNLKEARKILEEDLKLKINEEKTHLCHISEGVKYLGFVIYQRYVAIQKGKVELFKEKVKRLTKRNQGLNLERVIKRLNMTLRGWLNYYRIANIKGLLKELMCWIRRRLRMKKMKEWKYWKGLHKELRRRGYRGEFEKISVTRWRNSSSPLIHMALPNTWFDYKGLYNMERVEVGILHNYYEI